MANNDPKVSCSRIPENRKIPGGKGAYMQGPAQIQCAISKAPTDKDIKLLLIKDALKEEKEVVFPQNTGVLTQTIQVDLEKSGAIRITKAQDSGACEITDKNTSYQIEVAPPKPKFLEDQGFKKVNSKVQAGKQTIKCQLTYEASSAIKIKIISSALQSSVEMEFAQGEKTAEAEGILKDTQDKTESLKIENHEAEHSLVVTHPTLSLEYRDDLEYDNGIKKLPLIVIADFVLESMKFLLKSEYLQGGEKEFTWSGDSKELQLDLAEHAQDPNQSSVVITLETKELCKAEPSKSQCNITVETHTRLKIDKAYGRKIRLDHETDTTAAFNGLTADQADMELNNAAGYDTDRYVKIQDKDNETAFLVGKVLPQTKWKVQGAQDQNNWGAVIYKKLGETTAKPDCEVRVARKIGVAKKRMEIEAQSLAALNLPQDEEVWIRFSLDNLKTFVYGNVEKTSGDKLTIKVKDKRAGGGGDRYKKRKGWKIESFQLMHATKIASCTANEVELKTASKGIDTGAGQVRIWALKPGKTTGEGESLDRELEPTKKRQIQLLYRNVENKEKNNWGLKALVEGDEYQGPYCFNDRIYIKVKNLGPPAADLEYEIQAYAGSKKLKSWTFKQLTAHLQLTFEELQTIKKPLNLELRLIGDRQDKKTITVNPIPQVTFLEDKPVFEGRPKKKEHYTIVDPDQLLQVEIKENLPQQLTCFRIENSDKVRTRYYRMIEKGQEREICFLPGEGGTQMKCFATFGNRGAIKPSPKKVQLSTMGFLHSEEEKIASLKTKLTDQILLKFSRSPLPAFYFGEESSSHPMDCTVAIKDQVWIRVLRDGNEFKNVKKKKEGRFDSPQEVTEAAGVTLSCGAFARDENSVMPIVFEAGQKISKPVCLQGNDPEKGLQAIKAGCFYATIELNETAKKSYQAATESAGAGDRNPLWIPGALGFVKKVVNWLHRPRVPQRLRFHSNEKRLAYFPLETIETLKKAKPGDTVRVIVRLTIKADIGSWVKVSGPKSLESDYHVRFAFGQYEAQFDAKLKPEDQFEVMDAAITEIGGRLEITGKGGGRHPSEVSRYYAYLPEQDPIEGELKDSEYRIKSQCKLSILFSGDLPLPPDFSAEEEHVLELSCPELFSPTAKNQENDSHELYTLKQTKNTGAYQIQIKTLTHFIRHKNAVLGAARVKMWDGKSVHSTTTLHLKQDAGDGTPGQVRAHNGNYQLWKDDDWRDCENLEEVNEGDICADGANYYKCAKASPEAEWTRISAVKNGDICIELETCKLKNFSGGHWNTLSDMAENDTYVRCDPNDESSALYRKLTGDGLMTTGPVEEGDLCIIGQKNQYQKRSGGKWTKDKQILDDVLFCCSKAGTYWLRKEGAWEEGGLIQEEDVVIQDNKYFRWSQKEWQEAGEVKENDLIRHNGKLFKWIQKDKQWQWEELATRPSNRIEVPISLSPKAHLTGKIILSSLCTGLGCMNNAGVGTHNINVVLQGEKPAVEFKDDWITPPLDTFAIGDKARVFLRFSREVAARDEDTEAKKVKILEKLPSWTFLKRTYVIKENGDSFYYEQKHKKQEKKEKVKEGDVIIDRAKGKKGRYKFINNKWVAIQNVTVNASFINKAKVSLGEPDQAAPHTTDYGYAEIEFAPRKSKKVFNKGAVQAYSDDACNVASASKPISYRDKRWVKIIKESIPKRSSVEADGETEFSLGLSLPAPLYGAKVTIDDQGGRIKTVNIAEEGYALCEDNNLVIIPEGQFEARVRIKISQGDDVKLLLKEKEKGCCVPRKKGFKPKVHVGPPEIKRFHQMHPRPQAKKGQQVHFRISFKQPAPKGCAVSVTSKGPKLFNDVTLDLRKDARYAHGVLTLTTAPGDKKIPLKIKCGDSELEKEAKCRDALITVTTDPADLTQRPCGSNIQLKLKSKEPDKTVKCFVRSTAFGGKAYHTKATPQGHVQPVTVSVPGKHPIYFCSANNPEIKIDDKELIEVEVKPSDTSPVKCPKGAIQTDSAHAEVFSPEELELPCNLHSLKITVKHHDKVAENRGDKGSFYVTREASLVKDKTKKPLVYNNDRFPVIQVIGGKDSDLQKDDDKNKEIHRTYIEVDLNQPEGYPSCERLIQYSGIEQPVTHPFLLIMERFQTIKKVSEQRKSKEHIPFLKWPESKEEKKRKPRMHHKKDEVKLNLDRPCPDLANNNNQAEKKRNKRTDKWFYLTPDPVREALSHTPEVTDDSLPIVGFRALRAKRKWLARQGVEQYLIMARSCGLPHTQPPGDEGGPNPKLCAIVEVFSSAEHAFKIGGPPESKLYSFGHEGKFFDPEKGFDPDKGFDSELKKGLREAPKAGAETALQPVVEPGDDGLFTFTQFQNNKGSGSALSVDPMSPEELLAPPEGTDLRQHIDFYNEGKAEPLEDKLAEGAKSDYLFYDIEDYESVFDHIPEVIKEGLTYGGVMWTNLFGENDNPLMSHEGSTNPYELGQKGTAEQGFGDSWKSLGTNVGGLKNFGEEFMQMFGHKLEDETGKLKGLTGTEYAERWLGAIKPFGMLRDFRIGKNGKFHPAGDVARTALTIVSAAQNVAQFVLSIVNNLDFKYGYGFGMNVRLSLLQGEIVHYQGWKERTNNRVFKWSMWDINCNLVDIEVEGTFGAGFSAYGIGCSAMVFASLALCLGAKFKDETMPPEKQKGPSKTELYADADLTGKIGVRAYAIHEAVASISGAAEVGIKVRLHWIPLFKTEIYNTGLSVMIEIKAALTSTEFKWWLIKPDTDKLPLLTTNHWLTKNDPYNFRAEDSPESRAQVLEAYSLARGIMVKIQKRLSGYLRMYQLLKLNMYMVGGRPPRTDLLPGHKPLEDPNKKWEKNHQKWQMQWDEVKEAFEKEDHKVPGRGVLWKHTVRNKLKGLAKSLDGFEASIDKHLQKLDKIMAKYKKHADAYAEIMNSKEAIDTSVLAQHIREATELGSAARKLFDSPLGTHLPPVVSRMGYGITRNIQRGQYFAFELYLKDMHHYALRRKHW